MPKESFTTRRTDQKHWDPVKMNERRRGPRVPIAVPIMEEEFFITTCGVTLNVSEFGLRYFKIAAKNERTKIKEKYHFETLIRSINFSIPIENIAPLNMMCSIVHEKHTDDFIETSCEFICLTNEQRHSILRYLDIHST